MRILELHELDQEISICLFKFFEVLLKLDIRFLQLHILPFNRVFEVEVGIFKLFNLLVFGLDMFLKDVDDLVEVARGCRVKVSIFSCQIK